MSVDRTTCFPPLNNDNYMELSIHMEAELICKGLWDNVQCEVSVEGEEAEEIVMKWCGKCTQKKRAKICAEIIMRTCSSHTFKLVI
jgi:hypothetical protein